MRLQIKNYFAVIIGKRNQLEVPKISNTIQLHLESGKCIDLINLADWNWQENPTTYSVELKQ